ncbi:MAG: HEPN domain-containing protein [Armatimonadetes bacterium]|nr:HEPN domain-containing protein [Armatimonadota bacterium]
MSQSDLHDEVRQWLRYATEDLEAARLQAEGADPVARIVGFHAQQAVEKALKAILVFLCQKVPRTHDREALAAVTAGWDVHRVAVGLADITDWATVARYPGEEPAPVAKAVESLGTASTVLATVKDDLRNHGLAGI